MRRRLSTFAKEIAPMTTAQFARELGITAEHLRKVVQKNGQYYGVTPTKLPNGHLLWPSEALAKLKGGAQ